MSEQYQAPLDDIDAAATQAASVAADMRQLAAETAAGAAAATGSVADATSALLTALAGSIETAADYTDAAHRQLSAATAELCGVGRAEA